MPNQHTKKKQANKPEAPREEARREQPEIHVHALDLGAMFRNAFPKMGKCDEKAARGMPHFTLLATDNFAPVLIRQWIALAIQHGTPEEKILEAKAILKRIEGFRTENPLLCKTPD